MCDRKCGGGSVFCVCFGVNGVGSHPMEWEKSGDGMTWMWEHTPCQLDFVAARLLRGLRSKPLQISLMALNAIYRKTSRHFMVSKLPAVP